MTEDVKAMIRNRYNRISHPAQDTKGTQTLGTASSIKQCKRKAKGTAISQQMTTGIFLTKHNKGQTQEQRQ